MRALGLLGKLTVFYRRSNADATLIDARVEKNRRKQARKIPGRLFHFF
jgi:hypothetical protein